MVGLSVCYDLRFPELYQALTAPGKQCGAKANTAADEAAEPRGAEILLVPAAFTRKTGQPHWEVLLRARAIETQCYVVAAAQCGPHNEQRTSYGHTLIVDPWGTIGKPDISLL